MLKDVFTIIESLIKKEQKTSSTTAQTSSSCSYIYLEGLKDSLMLLFSLSDYIFKHIFSIKGKNKGDASGQ
jgi:hypothetical protein